MRQVPHYLLIGNGRVARHFQHYFSLLHIPFDTWQRGQVTDPFKQATHILLLINDKAIEGFITEHLAKTQAVLVHCSGSHVSDRAFGFHPLMTFGPNVYSLKKYQSIPFIVDDDAPPFHEVFPQLSNPHIRLNKNLKAKYHALCVLSGNFSCMLWQKLFSELKNLNIPQEMAHPYLMQQTENLLTDATNALTGPLVRKDKDTLKKNLLALENDPFQQIYQSFITCYQHLTERTQS